MIELTVVLGGRRCFLRIDHYAADRILLELPGSRLSRSAIARHPAFANIPRRFGGELVHAAGRTEKVGIAVILRFAASLRRIDRHAADGVFRREVQRHVFQGYFGLAHNASGTLLFTVTIMLYIELGSATPPVARCNGRPCVSQSLSLHVCTRPDR